MGTWFHAFNKERIIRILREVCSYAKIKQLSDNREVPDSLIKKELGGLGEEIFIERIEFDPGFTGSLTCVWRKGSGEVKEGGHSFISSFSRFGFSLMCQTLF